jgi:hypothetical protein
MKSQGNLALMIRTGYLSGAASHLLHPHAEKCRRRQKQMTEKTMNDKKKPTFSIRIGKIKATCWKNTSGENSFMSYKLSRSYKDKEGHWMDSDAYGIEDLPVIASLVAEIQRRHLTAGTPDSTDVSE